MFEGQSYLDCPQDVVRRSNLILVPGGKIEMFKKKDENIDVNMLQLCNFALFAHRSGWQLLRRLVHSPTPLTVSTAR